MDTQRPDLKLYTVGHSNVALERLIQLLQNFDIEVIVDVRSAPYSQYTPHFNREALKQSLAQAGIDYRFAGEYLGGRPDNPRYYKSETLPSGKTNYLQEVDYEAYAGDEEYLKGIRHLLKLAESKRVAIMCSEADPKRCHRHHLITQITLLPMGVQVYDIRGDGQLQAAQREHKQATLL